MPGARANMQRAATPFSAPGPWWTDTQHSSTWTSCLHFFSWLTQVTGTGVCLSKSVAETISLSLSSSQDINKGRYPLMVNKTTENVKAEDSHNLGRQRRAVLL